MICTHFYGVHALTGSRGGGGGVWAVVLVVGTAQSVSKKSNIENAMSLQSRVLVSESSHIQNKSHSYNYSLSQPSLSIRRLFLFSSFHLSFFFLHLPLLPARLHSLFLFLSLVLSGFETATEEGNRVSIVR